MIDYIMRTHEKVDAIKLTGQHAGVDLQVMETVGSRSPSDYVTHDIDTNVSTYINCMQAFAPLLAAIDKAVSVYKARK